MKGIIFDSESVRAILRGDKTQTRRVVKPQPVSGVRRSAFVPSGIEDGHGREIRSRYRPGEVVYVRETHTYADAGGFRVLGQYVSDAVMVDYRADAGQLVVGVDEDIADQVSAWIADREVDGNGDNWRSPIHMPEWAARIHLEITGVRVERLQDISEADALAEGLFTWENSEGRVHYGIKLADVWETDPRKTYARRWDAINRKRAPWESNPWVWVYEFRRVER